jgi:hypothetical protein
VGSFLDGGSQLVAIEVGEVAGLAQLRLRKRRFECVDVPRGWEAQHEARARGCRPAERTDEAERSRLGQKALVGLIAQLLDELSGWEPARGDERRSHSGADP